MKIPKLEAPLATFFLRIPLSVMFLQQGLSKYPVDGAVAEMWNLPYIVWWFVTWGEIGSAIGLLVGGVIGIVPWHRWLSDFWGSVAWNIGDIPTRFRADSVSRLVAVRCLCFVRVSCVWLIRKYQRLNLMRFAQLRESESSRLGWL